MDINIIEQNLTVTPVNQQIDVTDSVEIIDINTSIETIEITDNILPVKGDPGESFTSLEYVFNNTNTVNINHNKGYYPSIFVIDIFGYKYHPTIQHVNVNTTIVSFANPFTGTVIVN